LTNGKPQKKPGRAIYNHFKMDESQNNLTANKIARNAFYGFTSWILPLFLSLFATKLLIQTLGPTEYGIYTLVLGFVAYTFTFSVGRAATKYVAEFRATGESERIKSIVAATIFTNLIIVSTGVILIVLLSKWLVSDILEIETDAQARTVIGLYIASATIFFATFSQVFSALVQGVHRFDLFSKITSLTSFLLLGGNIFIALYNFGLLVLLIWNLFITFVSFLLFFVTAKKLLPEMKIFHRFDREILSLISKYSAAVIGYQIISNVLLIFERIWITKHFGTESLTFYVVPMMISYQIHYFISSIIIVLFPLASELQNDRARLERLYTKAMKIVAVLVVFICATLIIQSRTLLSLWLGDDFASSSANILVVHVISYSLIGIVAVSWQMTEGLGHPNFNCLILMICLIFTIPTMIWLSFDYAGFGVALGRLTGFLILILGVFYVEKWFFKKVLSGFWLNLIFKLSVAVLLTVVVEKTINRFLTETWLTLFLSTVAGGFVYVLALWFTRLVAEDEKTLIRRILKV
jgi:O-antigen/teichoic acid export membrane protein